MFCVLWDYSNPKQKAQKTIYRKHYCTVTKTEIKNPANPGLAQSSFEQPGPEGDIRCHGKFGKIAFQVVIQYKSCLDFS